MAVTLNHETHTYVNDETGDIYQSVTTFIGEYKKKFNTDFYSKQTAKKRGVEQSVILAEWKKTTEDAQIKGTNIHLVMENYLKDGSIDPDHKDLVESFKSKTKDIIKGGSTVHSEKLLYSHEHKLAGTADIIVEVGDWFYILDFKTNKKFNFDNKYNEQFFHPISHLQVCEFTTYSIQMSIYARMHEKLSNKKCAGLKLLYLRDFDGKRFWQDINSIYLKEAVDNLFDDRLKKISVETK